MSSIYADVVTEAVAVFDVFVVVDFDELIVLRTAEYIESPFDS
jgi:hypothetical protein